MRFKDYNKPIDERIKTRLTGKEVPKLFSEGRYDEIEKYIQEEAKATLQVMQEIYTHLKNKFHYWFTQQY